MEGYFYFYFIKMIFALLNRHEACLSILITISCSFQICKHILHDQITTPLLISNRTLKITIFLRKIIKIL